jgi:hypothetical protein
VSGFDVVEALQRNANTARIPILVVTAKQITALDRAALNSIPGKVIDIVEKAGLNSGRFIAEVRRAMLPNAQPSRLRRVHRQTVALPGIVCRDRRPPRQAGAASGQRGNSRPSDAMTSPAASFRTARQTRRTAQTAALLLPGLQPPGLISGRNPV